MHELLQIDGARTRTRQGGQLPLQPPRMVQIVIVPLAKHRAARGLPTEISQCPHPQIVRRLDEPDVIATQCPDIGGHGGALVGQAVGQDDDKFAVAMGLRGVMGDAAPKERKALRHALGHHQAADHRRIGFEVGGWHRHEGASCVTHGRSTIASPACRRQSRASFVPYVFSVVLPWRSSGSPHILGRERRSGA
jgi:hypothetical protein